MKDGLAAPAEGLVARACTKAKMVGTKSRNAQGARNRPLITTRPGGAFCPVSMAIGTIPTILASAV
jgi:hypothetical protein